MTPRSGLRGHPAHPARSVGLALALALLTLLTVAACSTGSEDSGSTTGGASAAGDSDSGSASAFAAEIPAPEADAMRSASGRAADRTTVPEPSAAGDARSLIRTGAVVLRSLDPDGVGDVLFEVRRVVAERTGEVAEERTEADDDGQAARALLTLRVPTDEFDETVTELRTLTGTELVDASTTTEDVSTEVIDVDVRVDLQRRSIQRISLLLDRAQSIRDVVDIERELARREADLGSLVRRQEFLADQTSFATITVSVQRAREPVGPTFTTIDREDGGFGAGLAGGWRAFTSAATNVSTASGALLPFAVFVLLLGIPVLALVRRRRTATDVAPATAAEPG